MTLQSAYQLHIDTTGGVVALIRNLLIGLVSPAEFITNLHGLGIEAPIAQRIAHDLNQKVFIPLQEKMKKEGAGGGKIPTGPVLAPVPAYVPKEAPAPLPIAAAPSYTPSVSEFSRPIPAVVKPVVPLTSVPTSTPKPVTVPVPQPLVEFAAPAQFVPPKTPIQEVGVPYIRTMSEDVEAVQTHKVPEMRPFSHESQQASVSIPTTPPAAPQVYVPPKPQAQSQPVAPEIVKVTAPQNSSTPPQDQSRSENKEELHKILKQYGIDPYREPVE
jgi:hypothetical protein